MGELVAEYEDSVGHNSNYLLELSPDPRGSIPPADKAAYVRSPTCTCTPTCTNVQLKDFMLSRQNSRMTEISETLRSET